MVLQIRYPIHACDVTEPLEPLQEIGRLVGGTGVEIAGPGYSEESFSLLGPRRDPAARRIIALRSGHELDAVEVGAPAGPEKDIVAWAVFLSPQALEEEAPMLMVFRPLAALGGDPVLVSEGRILPGELIVVPETCEMIVAVANYSGCPQELLSWYAITGTTQVPRSRRRLAVLSFPTEPRGRTVIGECVVFTEPLFGPETPSGEGILLESKRQSLQVGLIASPDEHKLLVRHLPDAPWERRTGEIYSQDSLDVVRWVLEGGGPPRSGATHPTFTFQTSGGAHGVAHRSSPRCQPGDLCISAASNGPYSSTRRFDRSRPARRPIELARFLSLRAARD